MISSLASAILRKSVSKIVQDLGIEDESAVLQNIDNLPLALKLAMQTILNAAATISGKATQLLPAKANSDSALK